MSDVISAPMCSLTQAADLLKEGQVSRCEFRRSCDDEGYLNLVLPLSHSNGHLVVEKSPGKPLNLLDYDCALETALKIGFTFDQMKINIQ